MWYVRSEYIEQRSLSDTLNVSKKLMLRKRSIDVVHDTFLHTRGLLKQGLIETLLIKHQRLRTRESLPSVTSVLLRYSLSDPTFQHFGSHTQRIVPLLQHRSPFCSIDLFLISSVCIVIVSNDDYFTDSLKIDAKDSIDGFDCV